MEMQGLQVRRDREGRKRRCYRSVSSRRTFDAEPRRWVGLPEHGLQRRGSRHHCYYAAPNLPDLCPTHILPTYYSSCLRLANSLARSIIHLSS
jgi:hypothetical protein